MRGVFKAKRLEKQRIISGVGEKISGQAVKAKSVCPTLKKWIRTGKVVNGKRHRYYLNGEKIITEKRGEEYLKFCYDATFGG